MADMSMGKLFTANLKRKFRFSFEVLDIGSSTDLSVEAYVKSVTSPQLTLEPVEVIHQTEKVYYPGRISWGTIDLVLVDDVDEVKSVGVKLIWENWVKKYYKNPEQGLVSWEMSEVKKMCILHILDAQGEEKSDWVLEGCWPTIIGYGDWDYSSSDPQELSITLQFDRAYLG